MTAANSFAHLGIRTDASLGHSLARPADLLRTAARHGYNTAGLCDLATLAAAPEFNTHARANGIRPLFGIEALVRPAGRLAPVSVRLFARDRTGWRNLMALRAALPEEKTLDWEAVEGRLRGVLLIAGGHAPVGTHAVFWAEGAVAIALAARETVGSDPTAIAIPNPMDPVQQPVAEALWHAARAAGIAAAAVPEVRSPWPEDDLACELVFPSAAATPAPDAAVKTMRDLANRAGHRRHLRPPQRVSEDYAAYPGAFAEAGRLAALCEFEMPRAAKPFPKFEFERGVDADSFLWNEMMSRAAQYYGGGDAEGLPPRWRERLDREFRELAAAGLADALIVFARTDAALSEQGISRGPGAGFLTTSLLASLLGLTWIDPVRFDLGFQLPAGWEARLPRLEVSVPQSSRARAAELLRGLYPECCLPAGRWQRWTPAGALEAVLEALGDTVRSARSLSKTPEWKDAWTRAGEHLSGRDPDPDCPINDPRALAWLSRRLDGRRRSLKRAEGVFLFAEDSARAALPVATNGACEWEEDEGAERGFGRFALETDPLLELLDESARWVRLQGDRNFDPTGFRANDDKLIGLMRSGRVLGVHPLESPRLRRRLREIQPSDLESFVRCVQAGAADAGTKPPAFDTLMMCFALLGIKGHHPPAFYAAALSQATADTGRTAALLQEARTAGLEVRALDLNLSAARWSPEDNAIRPGLMAVRGMTAAALDEIEFERREVSFQDLADLLRRCDGRQLRTAQIERLIRAGALDGFGPSRQELLKQLTGLDPLIRPKRRGGSLAAEPLDFFGQGSDWWLAQQDNSPGGDAREDTLESVLEDEEEALGLSLRFDGLYAAGDFLREARIRRPQELKLALGKTAWACLAGVIESADETPDANGALWAVCGDLLVSARPEDAPFFAARAADGQAVVMTGEVRRVPGGLEMKAARLVPLREAWRRAERAQGVEVGAGRLSPEQLKELLNVLKQFPGETPVRLAGVPPEGGRIYRKIESRRVLLCPGLEHALGATAGPGNWRAFVDAAAPVTRVGV